MQLVVVVVECAVVVAAADSKRLELRLDLHEWRHVEYLHQCELDVSCFVLYSAI